MRYINLRFTYLLTYTQVTGIEIINTKKVEIITGCVSPGFVVGRKDAEITAAHKLLVFHAKKWISRVEKLRVEHNLQLITTSVSLKFRQISSSSSP